MTEILAHEFSSESTQRKLSNEYKKSLHPCALDENSLVIGMVKGCKLYSGVIVFLLIMDYNK